MVNIKDAIGFVDCHYSPELGGLTSSRPLASTSFLGRYAFVDFALSNFCNSGIERYALLIKDHQRSILKHMGNMLSWVSNTKIGAVSVFYNERGQLNPAYNTDLNNIRENDWFLLARQYSYLLFASPEVVCNIDLAKVLQEHVERGERLTVVYKTIEDADQEFIGAQALEINKEGYITSFAPNDGKKKKRNVSLQIWIINRDLLAEMFEEQAKVSSSWGIREMIAHFLENGKVKAHAHAFHGYARRFDSLKHYVDYSFELLDPKIADTLFDPNRPIYTVTHDTAPALYGAKASVKNSFVSNGCIIEGQVEDSIVCRDVKVGKGAKVSHSILLSNVWVEKNGVLKDVVLDKYSTLLENHTVEGDPDNIVYLPQGSRL